ncbi:MAG TPA: hypothetical protein VFD63_01215 [Pyrinomonadaceae bacterium]|nr:hypothetical protein [Pyrinomonadaceae bacterium]
MKRKLLVSALVCLVGLVVVLVGPNVIPGFSTADAVAAAPEKDELSESIIQRGFEIAPVPLDLKGKNRALVGLGSYIVNTSGCNDCHTNPPYADGGDPFAGQPEQINVPCYLSGGMDFGPFRSRNLTPDSNGLPAGLTLEEFTHVLRTGEDTTSPFNPPFDNGLLQVMPWPVFGKKTDRELTAVYEYLSAIPRRSRCLTPAP